MRTNAVVVLGVCAALAATTHVFGAKADGPKARARVYAQFDKNSNGVLEPQERDAMRKAYEADKHGELRWFDRDQDGKLSDAEIDLIKPPPKEGAEKPDSEKAKAASEKPAAGSLGTRQPTNAPAATAAEKTSAK